MTFCYIFPVEIERSLVNEQISCVVNAEQLAGELQHPIYIKSITYYSNPIQPAKQTQNYYKREKDIRECSRATQFFSLLLRGGWHTCFFSFPTFYHVLGRAFSLPYLVSSNGKKKGTGRREKIAKFEPFSTRTFEKTLQDPRSREGERP